MFRATTTTCRTSLNNLFNSRRHYSGNAGQYCRDFVRKHDYESWVQSAFYPAELQDGYFALKAFYVSFRFCLLPKSTSSVPDRPSHDPGLGLQPNDWQAANAILERRDKTRLARCQSLSNSNYYYQHDSFQANHPIATALHNVRQQTSLPAYHFTRIIDARVSCHYIAASSAALIFYARTPN